MAETTNQGDVRVEISNSIATIEFSHPKSNSLPGKVLSKLANTIENAGNNNGIKVIILKSAGDRAFCAGASFDELLSIDDIDTGKEFFMGFARVINAARKCPKFIIGRVQGKAVGGGVGMAACVDYCFATKYASAKLSELAIGIGPFVVGPAVERKVGSAAFQQLAINATEWYSADWAANKGLYYEVYEDTASMDDAIKVLADKLALSNPEAMMLLKKAAWKGTEDWDKLLAERAAMSGKLVISEFTSMAISKFKGK
jgi:methylglutaconyl-CoA hydratase